VVGARLRHRSWLRRVLEVSTPQGDYVVEYNGRGIGYETVYVNGAIAVRQRSLAWFVPRFRFALGEYIAVLEVRVWPWLMLRELSLRVEGGLLYAEG
jgi:hypothetical protein